MTAVHGGDMKRALLVLVTGVLVGCTTPSVNYVPKTIAVSEPPINSINSVSVGDAMVRQGTYTEDDAIFVPQAVSAGLYTVHAGQYLKRGEDESVEFYYPGGSNPGRVDRPALVDPWNYVIVKKGPPQQLCVLTTYNTALTTCNSGPVFQRTKVPSTSMDSFQQTLIYSGRVGNKINVGYREFSNSLARPAFNNNVEYDLAVSKVIAYKGAQIEVLEATNQHIKYRLLRNFNAAER